MKKLLLALFLMGAVISMQAKDLKILAIGNSFSICVGRYLPVIVNRSGINHVKFASMYIGGCSLEQHWHNFVQAEQFEEFTPYQINIWDSNDPFNSQESKANIQQMLASDTWDIITLQQASHFSYRPETYEPYAANLIAQIKMLAPQAKIMVQQTWSYRKSDPRFTNNGGDWGVDQTSMYEKLTDAYGKFAATYDLDIIPTGLAVQIWRAEAPATYETPSEEAVKACQYPDLPMRSGDLVGNSWWEKKSGKMSMVTDNIHLNDRGEYLQACVWYLKLFGGTVEHIRYVPETMGDDFADVCKRCAAKAVGTFKE